MRAPPPAAPGWTVMTTIRPRARVLVVDDEEPLARLVAEYLTRAGFDVGLAPDGLTAVHRARRRGARPRAAGPGRDRGVPAAADVHRLLRDHADRPHGRGGQAHRALRRRRRLPDQAVQPARAGRPRPGHAAPAAGAGTRGRRSMTWTRVP